MLLRSSNQFKNIRVMSVISDVAAARRADDASGYSRTNGIKNQSITKPLSLDDSSGEVLVRKATGKSKVRKGQSEEEYQGQLHQYFEVEQGPKRTDIGWMDKVDPMALLNDPEKDLQIKNTRQKLTSFCQRLYYQKRYAECAALCDELLPRYEPFNKKNKIKRELEELEYMAQQSKNILRINEATESIDKFRM